MRRAASYLLPFAQITSRVLLQLTGANAPRSVYRLYLALRSVCGTARPGHLTGWKTLAVRELSRLIGSCDRTVRYALSWLTTARLIERAPRFADGSQLENEYRVLADPETAALPPWARIGKLPPKPADRPPARKPVVKRGGGFSLPYRPPFETAPPPPALILDAEAEEIIAGFQEVPLAT